MKKSIISFAKLSPLYFCLFALPVKAENLADIFTLASSNDPEIREARANYDATHTNVAQGLSQLLPSVNLTANTGKAVVGPEETFSFSDNYSSKGYGLNLKQNLLNFQSWYQFKSIQISDQVAATNLAALEQQLILRVSIAYFNVLRSIDNLASFEAEVAARERVLEQATQRFEVGLVPITDVYDSQASHDLARVNMLVEQNNLSQSYEALEAITGRSHSNVDSLMEDFPIVPVAPVSIEEWMVIAEQNNLEIIAAKLNYDAMDEDTKAAKAAMYPTLDLSASYGWSESGSSYQFISGSASENASVTINLNVPLYAGGLNSARKRQAYYSRNASEEALLRTQRSTTQNTRNSYRSVQSDVLTVAANAQAIVSVQSALEATEVGVEVGSRNVVELALAQGALYQALRTHANARYNYIINTLNLKQAAGILNPQDIVDLSEWLE